MSFWIGRRPVQSLCRGDADDGRLVNLLLLLSALMSALCAAGPSAQARAPQSVSRSVATEQVALVAVVAIIRHPVQSVPGLVAVLTARIWERAAPAAVFPATPPIFASRRRE